MNKTQDGKTIYRADGKVRKTVYIRKELADVIKDMAQRNETDENTIYRAVIAAGLEKLKERR